MELMDLTDFEVDTPIVDQAELEREQWFKLRAGKFTCSRFGDLIGSGRRKEDEFSQTAWNYIYQVAGERLGSYLHEFDGPAVRWGRDYESSALLEYLTRYGILDVSNVRTGTSCFCEWKPFAGGTPDALIDNEGCVEIKCPYTPQEHIRTIHENAVPERYVWQVHGHMLVSCRKWCDFVSFDPRIESEKRLHVIRVERNEAMLKTLTERLTRANEVVCEILAVMEDLIQSVIEWLKGERAPLDRHVLAGEISRIAKACKLWPIATQEKWSQAIDLAINRGLITESNGKLRLAPIKHDAQEKQLDLF